MTDPEFLPEPTDAEIERSSQLGDTLTCELLDQIEERSDDPAGVLFSIWMNLAPLLVEYGWTADGLAGDVRVHLKILAGDDGVGEPEGSA